MSNYRVAFISVITNSSIVSRGLPMSMFSVVAVGGTGLGPVFAGWIEMNTKLEWRWIQWIQMMCATLFVALFSDMVDHKNTQDMCSLSRSSAVLPVRNKIVDSLD